MNRLLSKTPDPTLPAAARPVITFTYNPATGKRASMADASGTTTYLYDGAARIQQVFKPAGQLFYTFDLANNLTSLFGTGAGSVAYTYDALNRLSTAVEANTGTTSYGYDAVGNLQSVTYPNGVVHAYTYDNRNRLTNLGVNKAATPLASYAYTLDAAGHRTQVVEGNGRTVTYAYDNLYRLTSETMAGAASQNGSITYTYDPVGNRKTLASTVPAIPAGLFNYDANDRFTAGDTYDANGNTVTSGGIANVYDFENHLIQKDGITIIYDGDGNRVQKTVAGVTTKYLVDDLNPTGYSQTIAEIPSNTANTYFVWGLEQISRRQTLFTPSTHLDVFYFTHDGHGSVRQLTNPSGAITDTYDYDAFGNLLTHTGTTPNNYLFAGEQFDPDLNLYYNRARYLDVRSGRFWSMNAYEGDQQDPVSLHKYLYASADPANRVDPTGQESAAEASAASGISLQLDARMALEILKAGAKVLALACTVAIGIAAVAGGGACGVDFNEMRVQLQEGNLHTFGLPLRAPSSVGVSTLQVRTALFSIYLAIFVEGTAEVAFFPKNASGSFVGLLGSVIYLSQRVGQIQAAGGVAQGGRILTDQFTAGTRTFRIDIDNLRGHNLRQ